MKPTAKTANKPLVATPVAVSTPVAPAQPSPNMPSPAQMALLGLFKLKLSEQEIILAKDLKAKYLLTLFAEDMGKHYESLGWTDDDFERLLNDPNQ